MKGKLYSKDIKFIDFFEDEKTMRIYYEDGCVTDLEYKEL